jgi:hypothetical protein
MRAPFTLEIWRRVTYASLSIVCLAPLVIGTAINASLQIPAVTLAAFLVYFGGFIALDGRRFERWRTSSLLGVGASRTSRRRFGRELTYLLVNIPIGCLSIGLVVGWIIISVRNVLFYPVFGWTSYPNPSWGGPTPIGAVSLHLAAGLVVLFGRPWLISSVTRLQESLVDRLLDPVASQSRSL